MKHKIIEFKKIRNTINMMFAMIMTLCARPLMAFADVDDTYWPEDTDKFTVRRGDGGQYRYGTL